MATNYVQAGRTITCKFATAQTSGTFVFIGEYFCGVVQANTVQYDTSDYRAAVDSGGVYDLSIEAKDGAGNSAVTFGDKIYWDAENSKLNKKDAGKYAGTYVGLTDITAGTTATGPTRLKGGA